MIKELTFSLTILFLLTSMNNNIKKNIYNNAFLNEISETIEHDINFNLNKNEQKVFRNEPDTSSNNTKFDINNVALKIKEDTITSERVIVLIENKNQETYIHYPNFEIEIYSDNEWKHFVTGVESVYDEDEVIVPQNSSTEMEILFKNTFKNENTQKVEMLESGKYRLKIRLKSTMYLQEKYEYLEFKI